MRAMSDAAVERIVTGIDGLDTVLLDRGLLVIEEVEALEKSPAEFASMVREEVEQRDG